MRRIFASSHLCTGCELCVAACSVTKGGVVRRKGAGISIKRDLFERFEFQNLCRQCLKPECVKACISGNLRKDEESGVVFSDPDLCVGCASCIMVCPFDSLILCRMPGYGDEVIVKCDSCPDQEVPPCVEVCPARALQVKEVAEER